jgi:class 3 adenylate cyclase
MERSPEIEAVMRRLYAAMGSGDTDALVARHTRRADIFLAVGSDPSERWEDPEGFDAILRAQVAETSDMPLVSLSVRAWEEGTVGWAFAEPVWDHPNGPVPTRDTFVLHLEADEWRIVHSHVSMGVSNLDALGRELTTSVERVAEAVAEERPDVTSAAAPDGTVTIAFTDIEDSTVLTDRLGDRAWMDVLDRHDDLVRRAVARHGGFVVKHLGDGFMLAFASAVSALHALIEVHAAITGVRADGAPLRVRAGAHTGEPIRQRDDFYGKTVVLASRVAGTAVGGQTLVTALVKEVAHGVPDIGFRDLGEVELKGLSAPVHVYEVSVRAEE